MVWFSRYEPLPAQVEALKQIYGDDVKILHVNRRFESTNQFLNYLKEVNAKGVYAVVPLEKIKEMMETNIGKNIDWLWAEYEEIADGVRKEEEKGFEPDKDIAGYYYNLGQHKRFIGFSKITHYELQTLPLIRLDVKIPQRRYLPKDEWKKAWKNAYKQMEEAIKRNAVSVSMKIYSDNRTLIAVAFEKNTEMFEELRPFLKDLGFEFNTDKKDWSKWFDSVDEANNTLNKIQKRVMGIAENIAIKILQRNNLPESKAEYLLFKMLEKEKIINVATRGVKSKSQGMGIE